ncbi:response regulator [Actinacidiphila rubida]|uniref:Two component transcriptional regulator, LuxR family n=1 Tax=Actinacidiphila rubida TaxID=310780 RepID=A0A1H8KCX3_9ACTN|nr:response regulator transcription factor [Actinacidiphila rubida]SEN90833.1 two component transcriptional regulator, LuxR family [Actinacidiphila rubida]
MTVTVLIADDQAVVRAGLAMLVDSQSGLEVVGQAADGLQAVRLAAELVPDVVLMDIRMPLMDGLQATRRITSRDGGARTRVVILTTYDLDEYVFDALRAGARGFLLKHAPPEELLRGIHAAVDGGALLVPTVTIRLIEAFTACRPRPVRRPPALALLTPREHEVFDLVVAGRTNSEISRTLAIAETTVKTHIGHVLAKLSLRDRVHAVIFAYEHGLVAPSPPPR